MMSTEAAAETSKSRSQNSTPPALWDGVGAGPGSRLVHVRARSGSLIGIGKVWGNRLHLLLLV